MKLRNISLNNLRRRKGKAVFLVLGLVIGVSTVVTLVMVSDSMNADIARTMDEYGANILIVPKTDDLALSYGGMSVSGVAYNVEQLHEDDIAKIRSIRNKDNIAIIAPKLLDAARIRDKNVLVVGVDFKQESRLKKWWRIRGAIPQLPGEAMVGSEVQQQLGLQLGQDFNIDGQPLRATAILQPTGSQDDGIIMIDLKEAQRLFKKPKQLSIIEVAALCYDCPIEEIVRQTAEKLPAAKVTAIRQAIESKMDALHRFRHFSLGISFVVLIIGALIVFTNTMAAVNERTREIGVFRAIGYRQSHIMKIILIEALLTSAMGGLIGYFAGFGVATIVAPILAMSDHLQLPMNYSLLASATVLGILVGVLATIYPAFKASRMDPTAALRAL